MLGPERFGHISDRVGERCCIISYSIEVGRGHTTMFQDFGGKSRVTTLGPLYLFAELLETSGLHWVNELLDANRRVAILQRNDVLPRLQDPHLTGMPRKDLCVFSYHLERVAF